jgi:hypothetical protein
MARAAIPLQAESGVSVLELRKGGNQMTAAAVLKRKLRNFPSANLSLRIGS